MVGDPPPPLRPGVGDVSSPLLRSMADFYCGVAAIRDRTRIHGFPPLTTVLRPTAPLRLRLASTSTTCLYDLPLWPASTACLYVLPLRPASTACLYGLPLRPAFIMSSPSSSSSSSISCSSGTSIFLFCICVFSFHFLKLFFHFFF